MTSFQTIGHICLPPISRPEDLISFRYISNNTG